MSNAHSVVKVRAFSRRSALALGLTIALFAESAAAARVVWKKTKIQEADQAWKVAFEVHLDRAPDMPHVPVRVTFTPYTYFERALVDGRKEPVIRQVPLEHQQPILESMDIGFLDPGTGKTAKRTRFSFEVTRDRGYEAGVYEVKVTDARTGKDMAGEAKLTLDGENQIVDRRSVVFDDKPKPKKDDAAATKAQAEAEPELTPDDDAFWAGGSKPPAEKSSPLPPPAHMQDNPACGCRVTGQGSVSSGWALGALALGLLARRRPQTDSSS
jgi:MYXO-CTERM domain-containing protein